MCNYDELKKNGFKIINASIIVTFAIIIYVYNMEDFKDILQTTGKVVFYKSDFGFFVPYRGSIIVCKEKNK